MTNPPVVGADAPGPAPGATGGIAKPASEGGVADPPFGAVFVGVADGVEAMLAETGLGDGEAVDAGDGAVEPGIG